ncbi:MAG: Crp/Fnr family transcriptional regulator [Eubacteriales bacterium]
MYKKWSNILSHTVLFHGIDAPSIHIMLDCLSPSLYSFDKNEYVTIEGDSFTGIGIMLMGEATISKENVAGNRIMVHLLKQGDIFGEMIAFSNRKTWPVSVMANQPSTVIFLPPQKLIGNCPNMCISHKELILNMLKIVSNRGLVLNKRLEYLSIKNVREKISTYLLELRELTGKDTFKFPMNRNELAEFLNVTRPSLSREMGRMRDEGMIDFQKSRIHLKNVASIKHSIE